MPHPLKGTVTQDRANAHAEQLANRVAKRLAQLSPRFRSEKIGMYRVYSEDIPEIRVLIDAYETHEDGLHLVLAEYEREQTRHLGDYPQRLAQGLSTRLNLPPTHIHVKVRRTRPQDGPRYPRQDAPEKYYTVSEGPLRFLVEFEQHIDTGLFGDHRKTRARFGKESAGKKVLNLFAYTGAFTVHAAHNQATSTTSVDTNPRYLERIKANLALNKLDGSQHSQVHQDARDYLSWAARQGRTWDICICDPPSFSTRPDKPDFDVQLDHPELIRTVMRVIAPDGILWFSTNHQRFQPEFQDVSAELGLEIEDRTRTTLPEDFPHAHQCWRIKRLQKTS